MLKTDILMKLLERCSKRGKSLEIGQLEQLNPDLGNELLVIKDEKFDQFIDIIMDNGTDFTKLDFEKQMYIFKFLSSCNKKETELVVRYFGKMYNSVDILNNNSIDRIKYVLPNALNVTKDIDSNYGSCDYLACLSKKLLAKDHTLGNSRKVIDVINNIDSQVAKELFIKQFNYQVLPKDISKQETIMALFKNWKALEIENVKCDEILISNALKSNSNNINVIEDVSMKDCLHLCASGLRNQTLNKLDDKTFNKIINLWKNTDSSFLRDAIVKFMGFVKYDEFTSKEFLSYAIAGISSSSTSDIYFDYAYDVYNSKMFKILPLDKQKNICDRFLNCKSEFEALDVATKVKEELITLNLKNKSSANHEKVDFNNPIELRELLNDIINGNQVYYKNINNSKYKDMDASDAIAILNYFKEKSLDGEVDLNRPVYCLQKTKTK